MSAQAKRGRVHARIDRTKTKCNGPHQFPVPIRAQRPVVVFCTQCQTGKDIAT